MAENTESVDQNMQSENFTKFPIENNQTSVNDFEKGSKMQKFSDKKGSKTDRNF